MSGDHHRVGPECPLCNDKLALAEPALVAWFRSMVKPQFKQAHVSWSYRDQAAQDQAVREGRSALNYPDSPHNQKPAQALDLFLLTDQGIASFPYAFYSRIAQMNEEIGSPILWGGTFKHLGDSDHFELRG